MDAASYRRECLFRHPKFRDDLVGFYRRFPFLLKLSPRESEHPSFDDVPEGIRCLMERRTSRLIALIPRTLEDVFRLLNYSPMIDPLYAKSLWAYQRLNPRWRPEYFLALGTGETRETYRDACQHLERRWPQVPSNVLFWGQQDPAVYPSVIPTPLFGTRGMRQEWKEELIRLSDAPGVLGFIPVYPHTTSAEVEEGLRELRKHDAERQRLRGRRTRVARRRQRPDQYQLRLDVWDAYHNCQMLTPIAREFGLSVSTVLEIFIQASLDILGSDAQLSRSRRTRLLQGVDPAVHVQGCVTCQAAFQAGDLEKMCATGKAWALQDQR